MPKLIPIHIASVLFLISCQNNPVNQIDTQNSKAELLVEKKPAPQLSQTVEEAVNCIIQKMSEQDKERIRTTKKEDLVMFHHGWGTGIRNSFQLWGENNALLNDTGKRHPDDASMAIIQATWEKLQKTK